MKQCYKTSRDSHCVFQKSLWLALNETSQGNPQFSELRLRPELYNIVVTTDCLEACIMLLWHGLFFLSFCSVIVTSDSKQFFKKKKKKAGLKRFDEWCSSSENVIVQSLCPCFYSPAHLFIIVKLQNQCSM